MRTCTIMILALSLAGGAQAQPAQPASPATPSATPPAAAFASAVSALSSARLPVQIPVREAQLKLSCESKKKPLSEAQLIQKRKAGAVFVRTKAHLARVKSGAGWLEFADTPPFDEPLSGVLHTFCDMRGEYLLLAVADEGRFGGKLVHLPSGRITPGGLSVHFSRDGRAYFANEQPDGLDGNEWMIYAQDGRLSWQGYNFIEQSGKPGHVDTFLSDPRWLPNGEFSAKASCDEAGSHQWPVKLIKQNGQWEWQPRRKCGVK
ncbi:hypothetical protein V8J88_14955 [Massilia sp. W12]|uniref:hypothetical protein n=1 Tax=Massilia sp. W12 TaxID=3126507 RepID=UPI0030CA8187